MNIFQLVLKQMRQRALSTWLTLLSVLLGVALAVSILILRREAGSLFGQTDYGYDVIIGKQGSALQLVVNTVYHIDTSPGTIPYSLYEKLTHVRDLRGDVRTAVPFAVGDSYKNLPIVGTIPQMIETPVTQVRDAYISQDDFASDLAPPTDAGQRSDTQKEWRDREQTILDLLNKAKDGAATYDPKSPPLIDAAIQQVEKAKAAIDQAPFDPATLVTIKACVDPLKQAAQTLADSLGLPNLMKSTGPLEYRPERTYQIAEGRDFAYDRFECVIGSDVSKVAGLKIGDEFQATHGFPRPNETPDIHKPKWKIVGVLKQTHTAADRVLHIPLLSFYTIAEHGVGLVSINAIRNGQDPNLAVQALKKQFEEERAASTQPEKDDDDKEDYKLTADGRIQLELPQEVWGLSGIMVKARSAPLAFGLMYVINNGQEASAVNPASVMRGFFENFLNNSAMILLVIAILVSVVAGVGILVSIYNSVAARMKEIAILRALGATKTRILALICVEAGLIGLFGGFSGLIAGHLVAAGGSAITEELLGQTINWLTIGHEEWLYLVAVVVLSVLAGLVPAMKAYRVPVATNLVVS